MSRRAVVLFCLSLLTLSANVMAQQQPPQPTPTPSRQSLRDLVMKPVVYSVPGMDKVKVKSNLKYTDSPDPNLLRDVYAPPGLAKGERRPAVIFIHGGAGSESRPKDWGIYISWGRLVAASGMVGVTFTHRLNYPKPYMHESAADVEAGGRQRRHAGCGQRPPLPRRLLRGRPPSEPGVARQAALRPLPRRLLRLPRRAAV